MANVELKAVRKAYAAVEVIKGFDPENRKGEFIVFVGPSGCGKSTLLRLISGWECNIPGDFLFDAARANNLLPSKRGIAMVFQGYALYPHMKVYDNMAFGMKLSNATKEDIDTRVHRAAEMLQIDHLLDRLPKQLSGGQRQRVATRLEIARRHHEMNDVTKVYVTHDQVEAMTLAGLICVLRDGRVEQLGTPSELYERPNSIFVAGFIGSPKMNFLEGSFAQAFDCATLGIRVEHIEIVPEGQGTWQGKVVLAEDLGSDHCLFADIGGGDPIIVRQNGKLTWGLDTPVSLRPLDNHLHRVVADGTPIR
jgi:multiple sugar transport system ATP-binding protein